jgi:hypothetical protein
LDGNAAVRQALSAADHLVPYGVLLQALQLQRQGP